MTFERPHIIRPPSEWRSYYLPLTRGCSNNTCTFCGYYGSKLALRDIDAVKEEIDAIALYMDHGVRLPTIPNVVYAIAQDWDGTRIFLQDGDALVYPFPRLVEALQYLNHKIPSIRRIATYATPQDILRRSPSELKQLRELKLSIFYTGLESGDTEILQKVGKGVDHSETVEAGRKAKEAGIAISITVLLGLGGIEGSEKHVLETANALTQIDPEFVGALTLTLIPGTPLHREYERGLFHPISPLQSLEELKGIIENSSFKNCFFSSMHASNYLSVRGRLPHDKGKMIGDLEDILSTKDASLLRPEFLRGL